MSSHDFNPSIYRRRPTDTEREQINLFFPEITRALLKVYDCKAVFYHQLIADRYAVIRMGAAEDKRYVILSLNDNRNPYLLADPEDSSLTYVTSTRANAEYYCKRTLQDALNRLSNPRLSYGEKVRRILWDMLEDRYPGLIREAGPSTSAIKFSFIHPLVFEGSPFRLLAGQNPVLTAQWAMDLIHGEIPEGLSHETIGELLPWYLQRPPMDVSLNADNHLVIQWSD